MRMTSSEEWQAYHSQLLKAFILQKVSINAPMNKNPATDLKKLPSQNICRVNKKDQGSSWK